MDLLTSSLGTNAHLCYALKGLRAKNKKMGIRLFMEKLLVLGSLLTNLHEGLGLPLLLALNLMKYRLKWMNPPHFNTTKHPWRAKNYG